MISSPRYFRIEEMVPQAVLEGYTGDREKLWFLFDSRVIWTADKLRMRYGKMVANTWFWGGTNHYRGFRPWLIGTGAELSQHKFGRALDLIPIKVTAEMIRKDMLMKPFLDEFKYIRCVEQGVTWLHFDVRNWIGPVLFINP